MGEAASPMEHEVRRRDVRSLRIDVCPPDGHVRLTVPLDCSEEQMEAFLESRKRWIEKARTPFLHSDRETIREYVSGETHYLLGRPYRLTLVPSAPSKCEITTRFDRLTFRYSPFWNFESRRDFFAAHMRAVLLNEGSASLLEWSQKLEVEKPRLAVAIMRRTWASATKSKLTLSLPLVRYRRVCIDYVVLLALLRREGLRDQMLSKEMGHLMPDWKSRRNDLDRIPLVHAAWLNERERT